MAVAAPRFVPSRKCCTRWLKPNELPGQNPTQGPRPLDNWDQHRHCAPRRWAPLGLDAARPGFAPRTLYQGTIN